MTLNASRALWTVAGSVALGIALTGTAGALSAGLNWEHPWNQPHSGRAAAASSDEYAWRLFVAVNWPADWQARAVDAAVPLGTGGPVVWETWANTAEIFRDDGGDPGPWKRRTSPCCIAQPDRFETNSLKELPNLRHIVGGHMVPLHDPVASARRLTEGRMNRPALEYIRALKLYNLDGQLKVLGEHRAVRFPTAATEVKAMWRPIGAAEQSRYYTLTVRLPDGGTRLYGLTALHIVTKDLPGWFWSTFEQVDNPTLTDADGWLLPSSDRFACPASGADCNRAPDGIGLEGTVWQNYRLRGTQTQYVDAKGGPQRLANSELEAGLQPNASCMTCHARASIGTQGGLVSRLPIFDDRSGSLDVGQRLGFVGTPQPAWFAVPNADGRSTTEYQALDFVWSLAKARPRRSM